jgi:predicted nuclease of predicted toxin-antitoxin system
VRLWLDEMIPAEVARQLRRRGYDVQAAQEPEHRWAWGLEDAEQLQAAARVGRALVTFNLRDFVPLSQQWAEAGREHAGIILVPAREVQPDEIGVLVRRLAALLDATRGDQGLENRVLFLR